MVWLTGELHLHCTGDMFDLARELHFTTCGLHRSQWATRNHESRNGSTQSVKYVSLHVLFLLGLSIFLPG